MGAAGYYYIMCLNSKVHGCSENLYIIYSCGKAQISYVLYICITFIYCKKKSFIVTSLKESMWSIIKGRKFELVFLMECHIAKDQNFLNKFFLLMGSSTKSLFDYRREKFSITYISKRYLSPLQNVT